MLRNTWDDYDVYDKHQHLYFPRGRGDGGLRTGGAVGTPLSSASTCINLPGLCLVGCRLRRPPGVVSSCRWGGRGAGSSTGSSGLVPPGTACRGSTSRWSPPSPSLPST